MAKATHQVKRLTATRKGSTALPLNDEARRYLRAHERYQATEQAFRTAAAADKASGRDIERDDYAPATVALRAKLHASGRLLVQRGEAIAARSSRKRKHTLADCLTLALASWHSAKARGACSIAVLRAAGIDMADGCRAANGLDL